LPRWRGAAPIQASILAGDAETGITIMQMEAGLDTGPMLLRESVPITAETTTASLHDTLAAMGARLILETLDSPPPPAPQTAADATYAPKLSREDGRIDWSKSAELIDRQIRAFDPWPGTFTTLAGTPLKILAAKLSTDSGSPGTALDNALCIACGSHAVRLTKIQLPGRTALSADDFLRGHPVPAGTMVGP
jgi:methionyl-tRNA formyltransferase